MTFICGENGQALTSERLQTSLSSQLHKIEATMPYKLSRLATPLTTSNSLGPLESTVTADIETLRDPLGTRYTSGIVLNVCSQNFLKKLKRHRKEIFCRRQFSFKMIKVVSPLIIEFKQILNLL